MVNDEVILSYLEEVAEKLEILVRDENINIEESSCSGGLCRVEDKYVIILNSKASVKEKIQVMIKALQEQAPDADSEPWQILSLRHVNQSLLNDGHENSNPG